MTFQIHPLARSDFDHLTGEARDNEIIRAINALNQD